jgi:hypothetical protein
MLLLLLIIAFANVSSLYAGESKKTVAVFPIENRVQKFKISSDVLADMTDKVIARLEGTSKFNIVEKSEMKKITKEAKEQIENSLYDMNAADKFGSMIGADTILFMYISGLDIEGEVDEVGSIVEITKGDIVVTLSGRFVDLLTGKVISNPSAQGRTTVRSLTYDLKKSKTLDTDGPNFAAAVKKSLDRAVQKLTF